MFEPNSPRLVSVRSVDVEAPLGGTMLLISNDDQPGVIGEVGTILGRHNVNIASFALGRGEKGAIGVLNVDEDLTAPETLDRAVDELRALRRPFSIDAGDVRDADIEERTGSIGVRRCRQDHRRLVVGGAAADVEDQP